MLGVCGKPVCARSMDLGEIKARVQETPSPRRFGSREAGGQFHDLLFCRNAIPRAQGVAGMPRREFCMQGCRSHLTYGQVPGRLV